MSEQTKRQATSEEMSMVKDLTRCVFVPASFDKRFVHSVSSIIENSGELTENQAALIPTLHYRYRRQHGKRTPNYDHNTDPKAHRVCHCVKPDTTNRLKCLTCNKPHRTETLQLFRGW